MPKKFTTINTKAEAARERKKNAKQQQQEQSVKSEEDKNWKDDDKQVLRKQQRKQKEEAKKTEQLQKKAELKALLEAENQSLKSTKNVRAVKLTRAEITKGACLKDIKPKPAHKLEELPALEDNLNHLKLEEETARNVDEAISILSSETKEDKHPEKRMKAAYLAFEERRLCKLKEENSGLRLSQMKQMIFKEWHTSAENPMNQKKAEN